MEKQNTTKSLSSRRRQYASCAADEAAAALNITSLGVTATHESMARSRSHAYRERMPLSVFYGDSVGQVREDYPSAREALAAARDFMARGARGVFVTDGQSHELTDAELETLADQEASEALAERSAPAT